MDLNQLFYRHQVSMMRAAGAVSDESRQSFLRLAGGYAERIAIRRKALGAGTLLVVVS